MQSQAPPRHAPANAVTTLLLSQPLDGPLTERQMAELRKAWLEHQVNLIGKIQNRGIPYSALNE